jgi:hypothetical protein
LNTNLDAEDCKRDWQSSYVCSPVSPDRNALAAEFQRAEKLAGIPPGSIVVLNRMLATGHSDSVRRQPGMAQQLGVSRPASRSAPIPGDGGQERADYVKVGVPP